MHDTGLRLIKGSTSLRLSDSPLPVTPGANNIPCTTGVQQQFYMVLQRTLSSVGRHMRIGRSSHGARHPLQLGIMRIEMQKNIPCRRDALMINSRRMDEWYRAIGRYTRISPGRLTVEVVPRRQSRSRAIALEGVESVNLRRVANKLLGDYVSTVGYACPGDWVAQAPC